jgi:hypothetical protein
MPSRAIKENSPIVWTRNRGRNGWDCPSDVPPEMSIDSLNVDLVQNALGRRRNGSVLQPVTGLQEPPAVLARFSPGPSDLDVELHYTTRLNNFVVVKAPEPVATQLAVVDGMTFPHLASWAALNGKLFWAYDSPVNRLHVYDPRTGLTVRRAGLSVNPSTLILSDTATAGTYAAILRYYRTRLMRIDNGVTLIGEAGPAQPWTPSGTKDGVSLTQMPSSVLESETHWRVEVSLDNAVWYVLSDPIVHATLTYIDRTPTTAYATKPAAPFAGEHSPFPSVKYLVADQDRLLGFGVWEAPDAAGVPPRAGRVYFTPVLDSTDTDDDERIDYGPEHPGYIDVGRNKGYEDRALAGPLDGQFFAFQSRGIHMLVPTGDVAAPFRRITLSPSLGAVSHPSTFLGEDEAGAPCLYFLDPTRGPYRYGARGLEWVGYDVQDVWATVNHAANSLIVAHGYYDSTLRAAVWFLATGVSNTPDLALAFFVREGQATEVEGVRYGFVRWIGTPWFDATSSLSYPRTLASTAAGTKISRLETGYLATGTGLIKINMPGVVDDAGTPFLAQVESPEFAPGRIFEKSPAVAYVQASAHADPIVTIRQTLTGDFGRVTQATPFTLTPLLTETRVLRKLPTLPLGNVTSLRVVLGDPASVTAAAWTIDEWLLTYETGGEV